MRRNNLILSNSTAPQASVDHQKAIQWYGGNLKLIASGVFGGATLTVVKNGRMPSGGDITSYADADEHPLIEWVDVHAFSAAGELIIENLPPCALSVKGASINSGTTRVNIIAGVENA